MTMMCVAFKFCAYTIHITIRRPTARETSVGPPLSTNVVFMFRTTITLSTPTMDYISPLKVDKVRQCLALFLSPLTQLGGPPPGMNDLAFTFRISSHKNTRCHDHEIYIYSGTKRPQKLTTAETRCSFHSLQIPSDSKVHESAG